MNPIRVLIADDHPVVRAGLRGLLAGHPEVLIVGEVSDGEEAVRKCLELAPAVVLMDLRMPRLDGSAATARIAAACPNTRVLVLTTYDAMKKSSARFAPERPDTCSRMRRPRSCSALSQRRHAASRWSLRRSRRG